MKRKVYLRADGNSTIGLGHVIRSAALASMLKNDFDCHFVIRNPLPALVKEIQQVGASVSELRDDLTYAEEAVTFSKLLTSDDIAVLDGYNFETYYQEVLSSTGCKLVCIDDIHAYSFLSDVIINHAGGISTTDYQAPPNCQFCLGPSYALLRDPFLKAARKRSENGSAMDSLLICMGGADPNNDTMAMLSMALQNDQIKTFHVVLGAAYRHTAQLETFIARVEKPVHLLKGLGPVEMTVVMKQCGVAICPPSSIAFEYLSVGGILYLHEIADNQKDIRKFFIEKGLAFDVNLFFKLDKHQVESAFRLQRIIFDGYSGQRLLDVFKKI